jgi:hypothetical protein
MPTVQVRHVTQRTLHHQEAGTSSSSTIHLESEDGTVHIRLIGSDPEAYPAGASFEVSITPAD